jgi:hypothetical protein
MDPSAHGDLLGQLYAEINSGMDELMRQTDTAFRTAWVGRPVADVSEAAEAAFADIGLHLSDEQIEAYAEAVSADRPFTFVLGEAGD